MSEFTSYSHMLLFKLTEFLANFEGWKPFEKVRSFLFKKEHNHAVVKTGFKRYIYIYI